MKRREEGEKGVKHTRDKGDKGILVRAKFLHWVTE